MPSHVTDSVWTDRHAENHFGSRVPFYLTDRVPGHPLPYPPFWRSLSAKFNPRGRKQCADSSVIPARERLAAEAGNRDGHAFHVSLTGQAGPPMLRDAEHAADPRAQRWMGNCHRALAGESDQAGRRRLGMRQRNQKVKEAARTLGRRGGLKGGPARAKKLSAKRRHEIAVAGGLARARRRDEALRTLLGGAGATGGGAEYSPHRRPGKSKR